MNQPLTGYQLEPVALAFLGASDQVIAVTQSNSNYGCNVILWDRVFGTYCGDTEVRQIGAGKAVPLSIKEQLALAFYSKERLADL